MQRTGQLPEDRAASEDRAGSRGQGRFQRTGQLPEDQAGTRGQASIQRTGYLPKDRTVSVHTVSSLVTEGDTEQTQSLDILVICSAEKDINFSIKVTVSSKLEWPKIIMTR